MSYLDQFLGTKLNYQQEEPTSPFSFDPTILASAEPSGNTWGERANSTPGFNTALINAGAALLGNKGLGGGLAAFNETLTNETRYQDKLKQIDNTNQLREGQFLQNQARLAMAQEGLPMDMAYKKAQTILAMRKAQDPNYGRSVSYGDYRNVVDRETGDVIAQVRLGNDNSIRSVDGKPFNFDPTTQMLAKDFVKRDQKPRSFFTGEDATSAIQFEYDPPAQEYFAYQNGQRISLPAFLEANPQARETTSKELGMDKESYSNLVTKFEDPLIEAEKGYDMLSKFEKVITESPDGGERYLKKIQSNIKTLFGQGATITDVEKAIKEGDYRAQSLVGMLREDVVGGGVMTEQDAIRVLQAMGGDTQSPVWNKDIALSLIQDLKKRREIDIRRKMENYNYLRSKRGFEPYTGTYYKQGATGSQEVYPPEGAKILDFSDL